MEPAALLRRQRARRAFLPALALPLGACLGLPAQQDADPSATIPASLPRAGFLLLGEVHDAPRLHAARLRWLEAMAAAALRSRTGRIVLALEQLDADRQDDLDRFQAGLDDRGRRDPTRARALAEAAGFRFEGWTWAYYEPVVQLALRSQWRLVGANLGAAEAMRIGRGGSAPWYESTALPWRPADEAAMQQEIRTGHCNALPERAIAPMSRAQRARDARMALALHQARLQAQAQAPGAAVLAILLAGNGHVRRDLGVPRHLAAMAPGVDLFSAGFLERAVAGGMAPSEARHYDRVVLAEAQVREDPCAAFKGAG